MRFSKKALSILLAVVMLASVFTFGVNAGAPDLSTSSTAKVGVSFEFLHEDGSPVESVSPGETITVNIYCTTKTDNDALTKAAFTVFFDSNVYSWIEGSREFVGPVNYISTASAVSVITDTTVWNNMKTADEKGANEIAANNWDSALYIQALVDGTVSDSYYVKENSDKVFCTAKLKVSDSVTEGTKANLGAPIVSAYAGKRGAAYNYVQTKAAGVPTNTNLVLHDCNKELTVKLPASGPVVAKKAAQAKFTYDTSTANGVADTFKLRIKSVITADDWKNYFANTTVDGATTNTLTAVGMVAFPAGETFNVDSANAAIAAIGDKEYAGAYKAASTTYIQKADDASDAYFGAIINIKHSTCTSNLQYIGYAQYLDADGNPQTIFYDAAVEAGVSGAQYDTLVENFKAGNWSTN